MRQPAASLRQIARRVDFRHRGCSLPHKAVAHDLSTPTNCSKMPLSAIRLPDFAGIPPQRCGPDLTDDDMSSVRTRFSGAAGEHHFRAAVRPAVATRINIR